MRKMKETFLLTFKDKQEHDEYIEKTDQEEIIKLFAKVCVLEGKEREDIV